MKEKKRKKKLNKKKKKFFIILACYIATFVLTSVITASTLSWFSGSIWQSEVLYMGGPVYIYFSDDSGVTNTSGKGNLVTETPPNWTKLYPGMNISFEARAVVEGKEFEKPVSNGETITYTTTGAVLRAQVKLLVQDPYGDSTSKVSTDIYSWIWPKLKENALTDTRNEGVWIFDQQNSTNLEDNYFYYVVDGQGDLADAGNYLLKEVGGKKDNETIGFLNNTIIQLPPIDLVNEHADCTLTFTIVFEAVQAFFPYTSDELEAGDNRVGLEKPLTVGNSRKIFQESQYTPENGYPYS